MELTENLFLETLESWFLISKKKSLNQSDYEKITNILVYESENYLEFKRKLESNYLNEICLEFYDNDNDKRFFFEDLLERILIFRDDIIYFLINKLNHYKTKCNNASDFYKLFVDCMKQLKYKELYDIYYELKNNVFDYDIIIQKYENSNNKFIKKLFDIKSQKHLDQILNDISIFMDDFVEFEFDDVFCGSMKDNNDLVVIFPVATPTSYKNKTVCYFNINGEKKFCEYNYDYRKDLSDLLRENNRNYQNIWYGFIYPFPKDELSPELDAYDLKFYLHGLKIFVEFLKPRCVMLVTKKCVDYWFQLEKDKTQHNMCLNLSIIPNIIQKGTSMIYSPHPFKVFHEKDPLYSNQYDRTIKNLKSIFFNEKQKLELVHSDIQKTKKRKITNTKNHKIEPIAKNQKRMVDILVCRYYGNKKLIEEKYLEPKQSKLNNLSYYGVFSTKERNLALLNIIESIHDHLEIYYEKDTLFIKETHKDSFSILKTDGYIYHLSSIGFKKNKDIGEELNTYELISYQQVEILNYEFIQDIFVELLNANVNMTLF